MAFVYPISHELTNSQRDFIALALKEINTLRPDNMYRVKRYNDFDMVFSCSDKDVEVSIFKHVMHVISDKGDGSYVALSLNSREDVQRLVNMLL